VGTATAAKWQSAAAQSVILPIWYICINWQIDNILTAITLDLFCCCSDVISSDVDLLKFQIRTAPSPTPNAILLMQAK